MQGRAKGEGRDNIGPRPALLMRSLPPLPPPHLLSHLSCSDTTSTSSRHPLPIAGLLEAELLPVWNDSFIIHHQDRESKAGFCFTQQSHTCHRWAGNPCSDNRFTWDRFARAPFGGKLDSHQLDVRVRTWGIGRGCAVGGSPLWLKKHGGQGGECAGAEFQHQAAKQWSFGPRSR